VTEAEKAARLVFPGFKFGVDDPREALSLVEMGVGGFCLYGGQVEEVAGFTARLQAAARAPLLFCADYEDGVASQCQGGTALSSNMGLGAANSETLAYQKGAITALEARALGVLWVLAPVLDLATLSSNPIVNIRSFSSDPGAVARLGRATLKGLRSERVLSCLKHFPGHGETREDSHLELPAVRVSRSVLFRRELAPFRALAEEADAVMTGHLAVPALERDRKLPYSLSPDIGRTLRSELGFRGLVVTDALSMGAVRENLDETEAGVRALLSGNDVLLVPARPRELIRALAAELGERPELRSAVCASYERLEHGRKASAASASPDPGIVGCRKHRETAAKMAEACLAWAGPPQTLAAGEKIRYWEPEASSPEDWAGEAFVATLREAGAEVRPAEEAELRGEGTLLVGSFLSPRAYTGRIEYAPEDVRRIRSALAKGGRRLLVSFGSPFVFEEFSAPGLCAFSSSEAAQRAAARAILGAIEVPGRMPVALRRPRAPAGS